MTHASLSPDRLVAPAPMLATLGPAPSGDQFAVEVKFDGQRGILTVDRRVRVTSRNGADVTSLGVGVLRMVENPTSRR